MLHDDGQMRSTDARRGPRRALVAIAVAATVALTLGSAGTTWGLPRSTEPTCDPAVEECPEPSPTPPPSPSPSPVPSPAPKPGHGGGGTNPPEGGSGPGGNPSGPDNGGPHRSPPKDDVCSMEGALPASGTFTTTDRLRPVLRKLTRRGMKPRAAMMRIVGPFPVAGAARWSDDWHALRCVPEPHLHQGIDIFAAAGTPLVATRNGTVSQIVSNSISGLGVEITDAGQTQYFYAHLRAFAPGLRVGARVSTGDVLGYVGDTGNARGTSPHVHLEIQPGGVPVPPKSFVDRWLGVAEKRGRRLIKRIDARRRARRRDRVEPSDRRRDTLLDPVMAEDPDALVILGLSSALSGSTVPVAYTVAGDMAGEIDWVSNATGDRDEQGAIASGTPTAVPVLAP